MAGIKKKMSRANRRQAPTLKALKQTNKPTFKPTLSSPFAIRWSMPDKEDAQSEVMALLTELINPASTVVFQNKQLTRFFKDRFFIGLNEVTKGLERDTVSAVMVCRDVKPLQVIQHLPVLCKLRSTPLFPLVRSSAALAKLFGAPVIALAVKKTQPDEALEKLKTSIVTHCNNNNNNNNKVMLEPAVVVKVTPKRTLSNNSRNAKKKL